jgi:ketosteroid isomerase-like protein
MTAAEKSELADRLFAAIEAGDVPAVRACYAPDARIWHNFDGREQTVEENLATLAWMCGRLSARRYEVTRREVLGDGLLQLHVLRGTARSGEPFSLACAMVLTMAAGRVTRIDEYLDTAQAAAL